MCGIAGILGEIGSSDSGHVRKMMDALHHRGPDDSGLNELNGAVLGHRRLSVIDLSHSAAQPMNDESGRYSLVFNGEIYNYRELREELAPVYPFHTHADTEVLLAALMVWGIGALERLNGMFAFCFYDQEKREAIFARDRFGQKPLYFAQHHDHIVFASEVKALLAAGVKAQPDYAVWARYLLHAHYDDGADTYFADVHQLLPGEYMVYRHGRALERRRWYEVAKRAQPIEIGRDEAAETIRELLVDATRLHMRADVPVGISLSGGLDSSALLACLELSGELSHQVGCVSVDFGGDLTERPWMEAAAGYHGLSTRIMPFTPDDFRASIEMMMWHLEGPIGGLMNCALAPVMAEAHREGMVVIQDGTGLDEALGGYRNHHNLYVGLALQKGGADAAKAVREYAANWDCGEDDAEHMGKAALANAVTAIDGTVPVRAELLEEGFIKEWGAPLAVEETTGDAMRDALASYLQVQKIPRNMRMKDRLSMSFSLELRLPFLDHRLVEFGLSLPSELMFLHGRTKSIVREALAGVMDDEVRLASKRSIQAPQGLWLMKEPMRSYVWDLITSDRFASRGIFNPKKCQAAFERFCTGADANSFFVWQWINVEEWFRSFVDGDAQGNRRGRGTGPNLWV